ncbi:MAG TPA: hypothetical protein DCY88_06580 [Cyanobacteria bacterium UBA11372]|nr:hypothetical protein [Cyanobacteria bacterium UBA11372]
MDRTRKLLPSFPELGSDTADATLRVKRSYRVSESHLTQEKTPGISSRGFSVSISQICLINPQ